METVDLRDIPVKTILICRKLFKKLSHWVRKVFAVAGRYVMTDNNVIIITYFIKKILPYMLVVGQSRKIRSNQGKSEVHSRKVLARGWQVCNRRALACYTHVQLSFTKQTLTTDSSSLSWVTPTHCFITISHIGTVEKTTLTPNTPNTANHY